MSLPTLLDMKYYIIIFLKVNAISKRKSYFKSKMKRSYQMRICPEIHFRPLDNKIFIEANKNAVRGCQKPTGVYYDEYIQE